MIKKLFIVLLTTAMIMPSFAFMHTDIGININSGSKKPSVYKDVFIDDAQLATMDMTRDEFINDLKKRSQRDWTYKIIDENENGIHYVGGHFETTVRKTNMLSDYITLTANADAEYYYNVKNTLGSKKVTVKIKPNKKQSMQLVSYLLEYGKGPDDEYCLVINTPDKIKTSNGNISPDGKSVSWDIKDIIVNEEEAELTFEYSNPASYVIFIVIFVMIAGAVITFVVMRKDREPMEYYNYDTPTPDMSRKENSFDSSTSDMSREENGFDSSTSVMNRYENKNDVESIENTSGTVFSSKTFISPKTSTELPEVITDKKEPATKKCPNCGALLSADETFCENCGTFI